MGCLGASGPSSTSATRGCWDRGDAAPEIVGRHLEIAYQERAALGATESELDELGRRAGAALASAGRTATARKEADRAVDLLRRAASLLAGEPRARVAVLPDLIDALVSARDIEAAGSIHAEAVQLALTLNDETSELRAELAWVAAEPHRDATGWQEGAITLSERAIDHFGPVNDEANLALALLLKGMALSLHDHATAVETLKEAQVHAERTEDERIQVEVWDELGGLMVAGFTPYPEILEVTRIELDWARAHGNAFAMANARLGEAYALAALGEFEAALDVLHELIDLFAQLPGRVPQHGECYALAGRIERDRRNPAQAAALYRRATDVFKASGHRRWWRVAAPGVVHALLDMDKVDEARAALDELAADDEPTDGPPGAFRLEAEARYRVRIGDIEGGLLMAHRAVEAIADRGALFYEGRARETLATLLATTGDTTGADREYELALSLYERKGYLPGVARVTAAAAGLPPRR